MMLKWITRSITFFSSIVFTVLLTTSLASAQFKLEAALKDAMLQLATFDDGGWSEALAYGRLKTEDAPPNILNQMSQILS
jgi:hypothetical protein